MRISTVPHHLTGATDRFKGGGLRPIYLAFEGTFRPSRAEPRCASPLKLLSQMQSPYRRITPPLDHLTRWDLPAESRRRNVVRRYEARDDPGEE
jgi:hypothetical protein